MRVEGLTIMYYTAWEENLWVLDKGSGNYKCQSQANERINGKGFKWHFLFLSYQENDSFGFHIRGGEMKKKQTDKFLECYYMSPVFISHIVKDSIADKWVYFFV